MLHTKRFEFLAYSFVTVDPAGHDNRSYRVSRGRCCQIGVSHSVILPVACFEREATIIAFPHGNIWMHYDLGRGAITGNPGRPRPVAIRIPPLRESPRSIRDERRFLEMDQA